MGPPCVHINYITNGIYWKKEILFVNKHSKHIDHEKTLDIIYYFLMIYYFKLIQIQAPFNLESFWIRKTLDGWHSVGYDFFLNLETFALFSQSPVSKLLHTFFGAPKKYWVFITKVKKTDHCFSLIPQSSLSVTMLTKLKLGN